MNASSAPWGGDHLENHLSGPVQTPPLCTCPMGFSGDVVVEMQGPNRCGPRSQQRPRNLMVELESNLTPVRPRQSPRHKSCELDFFACFRTPS